MKKTILALLIIYAGLSQSCTKTCDAYHTGKNCQTEVREHYYGTYTGTNSISGITSVTVSRHTENYRYIWLEGIYAELTNANDFTIPIQQVSQGGQSYYINGYGNITEQSLTMVTSLQGTSSTFTGTR